MFSYNQRVNHPKVLTSQKPVSTLGLLGLKNFHGFVILRGRIEPIACLVLYLVIKMWGNLYKKSYQTWQTAVKTFEKHQNVPRGIQKQRQILFHRAWKYPKASIIRFLLFYIQDGGKQVLLNPWEILIKELFFNKVWALQPANTIKTKFTSNSFQSFCLLFRNSWFKEQLFFPWTW